jgi:hypothetical protein
MPQSWDMGQIILLPLRRKARLRSGSNPRTTRPPKPSKDNGKPAASRWIQHYPVTAEWLYVPPNSVSRYSRVVTCTTQFGIQLQQSGYMYHPIRYKKYEFHPKKAILRFVRIIWTNTNLLTYLLHGAESFLRSQLVLQLVKTFPAFMEPESSLPHPHVPATCPYPEPAPSSLHHPLPLSEYPS